MNKIVEKKEPYNSKIGKDGWMEGGGHEREKDPDQA